jgi:hypothetical protein
MKCVPALRTCARIAHFCLCNFRSNLKKENCPELQN